jgi:hypothetical protein
MFPLLEALLCGVLDGFSLADGVTEAFAPVLPVPD